jgi:hypothetical protein
MIRVVPINDNHKEYQLRTSTEYKITGLPLNAQLGDLDKILLLIKGQTFTIPKPKPGSSTKTGYVMVKKEDFKEKIRKITCLNSKIFIIPTNLEQKICTQCGSPEHTYTQCVMEFTIDTRNRKTFKKIIINRNRSKVTIDENITKNYDNIFKLNDKPNTIKSQQQHSYTYNKSRSIPTYNTPKAQFTSHYQRTF